METAVATDWSWLDRGLAPRSVAVYGASSRSLGAQGARVADNLMRHGYADRIVFVNPRPQEIHGVQAVQSAVDSPLADQLDYAVIAVPLAAVVDAIADCARAGIGLATVITSGFAEVGGEGVAAERALLEAAAAHGVRLLGPNCMGLINFTAGVFAARPPFDGCPAGAVSVIAQSGNVACRLMEEVADFGQGVDLWVTMGNCADISIPEMLHYLVQRDTTRVIMLYLEGIPDAPALRSAFAAARQAGKEIVLLKPGRTDRGNRAIASHTGALASPDVFVDALVRETGVVRCRSVAEAAQVCGLLLTVGRLDGRIVVMAGSGGDAALVSDLCEDNRVPLAALHSETVAAIREIAPEAGLANPIDTTATVAQRGLTGELDRLIAADGDVACIVIIGNAAFKYPEWRPEWVETSIQRCVDLSEQVPVVMATAMRREHRQRLAAAGVGLLDGGDASWRALRGIVSADVEPPIDPVPADETESGGEVIGSATAHTLAELDAMSRLEQAGVRMVGSRVIHDQDELLVAVKELDYPVVLKGLLPGVSHKTDRGLVKLGIRTEADLVSAYAALAAEVGTEGSVVMQREIQGKVAELIVGAVNDPRFGVHVMLGLGGTWAELEGARAWHHGVVTATDARRMLGELALGRALLEGRRGVRSDIEGVIEVLQRVSQLAVEHAEEILELEINPLIVGTTATVGVDGVIRVRA